jgi:hypothetical protein
MLAATKSPAEPLPLRKRSRLIDAVAALGGGEVCDLARRAGALLQPEVDGAASSDLNPNGTPLQALLSARRDRWVVRLVGDPGFDRSDPADRWEVSRIALAEAVRIGGAESLRPAVDAALAAFVAEETIAGRSNGMIRLALPAAGPGLAVYVGSPPGADGWAIARGWLDRLLPDSATAGRQLERVAATGALFGVGVEGASPETLRLKLYWRLERAAGLAAIGVPLLSRPETVRFLADLLGSLEVPLGALTFSIGFDAATGALRDAKIDCCAANAALDTRRALGLVNQHAAALSLRPPPLDGLQSVLERCRVGVACLGFGVDRHGQHRLNTYLYEDR